MAGFVALLGAAVGNGEYCDIQGHEARVFKMACHGSLGLVG
jgi:hypothetical protein